MRNIGLVLSLAVSAGCGSSGGGEMSRSARAAALAATLEGENVSNPGALPMRGTATYAGFMTLGLPINGTTADHIGDLDLEVDFGATRNPLSGTVSNFDGLSGGLTIGTSTLGRETDPNVDFTFNSGISGTLGQGGDSYTIDGQIAGEFRGRNQDGMTGLVYGDITGPDDQDLFDGTFAATRSN